ncbi:MAG TPA: acyltransferase [Verrucomicrobiae bacterium]|nr:acyltransferase [Verrucomicrobiae bacterium]
MSTETFTATVTHKTASESARVDFVDNLRWVMIVLVVSMHAAVTYSHLGSWYFMEDPKPTQSVLVIFAAYQMFLQAFFMGLLFLLAGYFVPPAFDRKGAVKFLRDRAVRLGVPSLLYMVFIQPAIVYWLLRDFADRSRPPLTRAFLPYLITGQFLGGSGPMWFALALLGFCLVYAVVRALRGVTPVAYQEGPLPSNVQVAALAFAIGFCTFLVRIGQPMGTNILNMQLCFFSQYVALFTAGVYARRRNWLLRFPFARGLRWFWAALTAGTGAWLVLILAVLKTHTEDKLSGGLTWQSAALCFWESFFCVGVCLGLLVWFRERFNHRGTVARWLSDNSFAVYVFHPPILIAITLAMRGFEAPKLLKFLCATVLGVILTYLASSLVFRRIPLLKRVL